MKYFLLMSMICMPVMAQETWLQWRGAERNGQVQAETEWPDEITEDNFKLSWRMPLDDGYSSPIISKDLVITVETKDKTHEVVRAFDRKTGKQVWEQSWKGSMTVPFFARKNGSWIRSTPVCDGERVYIGGMRDHLVCLNLKDGKVVWEFPFMEKMKSNLPAFGMVSSPLIDGDFLYVQAGDGFVKIEKKTGKLIWRTLQNNGGMYNSAFASSRIATIQGKKQILVQTRTDLAGVDPDDGKVLWKRNIPAFRGMNILTPTPWKNAVFTSSYGGGSRLIEIAKNEDGSLEQAEKWSNKTQGYMSHPLEEDNYLYLHLRNRRIICFNLEDGNVEWKSQKAYDMYLSMVKNGNKVLALGDRGKVYLFRFSPKGMLEISSMEISKDPTWAHIAICGDEVFIREQNAIAAYRWK